MGFGIGVTEAEIFEKRRDSCRDVEILALEESVGFFLGHDSRLFVPAFDAAA
jgi:hypothetical protein